MEIESLFSSTRWEILKALSQAKLSPIELADKLKTTSANISQQLRLLELAGLIKSEKLSNSDKGKPRIVYSLAGDFSFIAIASNDFSDKKLIPMTKMHKFFLNSFFIDDLEIQSNLPQLYTLLKDHFDLFDAILVQKTKTLLIFSKTTKQIDALKKILNDFKEIKINFYELNDLKKYSQNSIILYKNEVSL
ncbi:MAG: ArsR family transcriptional regulator [Candidatus Woesearchaeota archaeon]